ncbi:35215_t:CDS:2, partial [Gigaspora margarita]
MYNLLQRANAIFAFAMTVTFGVLGAIAIVTPFLPSSPSAEITVKDIQVISYDYMSQGESEFAFIKLNLDADLTSLFNWNTKQLFVSVLAEYETNSHDINQVILWDSIIQSKEEALIKVSDLHNEYNFVDITTSFRQVNASYSLYWDVMPYVGVLTNFGYIIEGLDSAFGTHQKWKIDTAEDNLQRTTHDT